MIPILSLLFVLSGSVQGGTNWYVDAVNGSDSSGNGTYSAPYKTITNLWSRLRSGDDVNLFSGNYGKFDYYTTWVGTNAPDIFTNWVTFKALDPQNPPVFTYIHMGGGISGIPLNPPKTGRPTARTTAYIAFENFSITNGVYLRNLKNVRVKGCRITRQMDPGFVNIDPACPATNYIENIERCAVDFSMVDSFYLEGCEVTSSPHGVAGCGYNVNIISNEIHHLRHDGLRIWGFWDSVVEGNRIHNVDTLLTDAEANALYPTSARHADCIHIAVSGVGPVNTNVVIRNNILYDTSGQNMQFNIYGALQNYNFLIEGNIFGPSAANAFNNGAMNMTFRNNTVCVLPSGRVLNDGSRTNAIIVGTNVIRQAGPQNTIWQSNYVFRISVYGNGAKVYNNLLGSYGADAGVAVDFFDYNVMQITPSSAAMGVDNTRAFGRFSMVETNSPLQNPGAFDGVLRSNATNVINRGTHSVAAVDFPDIVGTPRDSRPDLGAWELPGQNPPVEPVAQQINDLKTTFLDDFEDGHYKDIDPWLNGTNTQGMSWYRPSVYTNLWDKFYVSSYNSSLDRNALMTAGGATQRVSWIISEQGANWKDYSFEFDAKNAYVVSNVGPAVLVQDKDNAYWLDIARDTGRLIRIDDGVETVLATNSALRMPNSGTKHYKVNVSVASNGITIAVATNGVSVFSYTDTSTNALAKFQSGRVGFHYNFLRYGFYSMQFDNVRVDVSNFVAPRIISLNLKETTGGGNDGVMASSDIAGADASIRVGNWNNMAASTSNTLAGSNAVYSSGAVVGGSFQAVWTSMRQTWLNATTLTNDALMYYGYDQIWNNETARFDLSGIPFTNYDIYVYLADPNSTSGRGGSVSIGGTTYYQRDSSSVVQTPNGGGIGYVRLTSTTYSATNPSAVTYGNYAYFSGLSGSTQRVDFAALNMGDANHRLLIAGIQIVESLSGGVESGEGAGMLMAEASAAAPSADVLLMSSSVVSPDTSVATEKIGSTGTTEGYATATIPDNQLYLAMDESVWTGAVGEVADISGFENDGTVLGSANTSFGLIGGSGLFDGVDDYIEVPDSESLKMTGDMTLSLWLVPDNVGGGLLGLLNKGSEYSLSIEANGGLEYGHGANYSWKASPAGTAHNGIWQHIVIVRDSASGVVRSYYNGELVRSAKYASVPLACNSPVHIATGYQGRIDEVRLYKKALSGDEIKSLFNTTLSQVQNYGSR